jgi:hypothetical protein
MQDDLLILVGAVIDPNLEAALYLLENGSCPVVTAAAIDIQKASKNEWAERFRRRGRAAKARGRLVACWDIRYQPIERPPSIGTI